MATKPYKSLLRSNINIFDWRVTLSLLALSRLMWQQISPIVNVNTKQVHTFCKDLVRWYVSELVYSSVPNRRACTFINFEEKIPPALPYFGLHVYCFWEKNPPARLFSCISIGICPANLLILRKKIPLHGLILVCSLLILRKKFPRTSTYSILCTVNSLILVCMFNIFVLHVYSAH